MKIQTAQHYTCEEIVALSRQWVETIVVGLNLCPFAAPVVRNDTLRYAVTDAESMEALASNFLQELNLIQEKEEKEIATTLVIMPRAVSDFYDYLDLLAYFEDLLAKSGLSGVFQLASFHPAYLFAGVEPDDLSHWTNRSPFPMVHIIREGQMSRVLTHYDNPEEIPERNIKLLRELGREGLVERFPPFADFI
ncbi:DUF1415 domain-containing protein [Neptunomonas antarctica]|uniref:DUF1415 domain-containing protein n=1 Tax=Neptunomonas antarctica TaxID=619304 RepID=A0A1N7IRS2_9GAMM|nr:DUF1415 domain-containing protein [Neptunomonas antarctica]SIS39799.1 hypothetical protein SAMN05421760_10125 [Neptunomonas antarctica]